VSASPAARALLISPDPDLVDQLGALLGSGVVVTSAADLQAASRAVALEVPSVVVLDVEHVSLTTAIELLERSADAPVPVVLIVGQRVPTVAGRGRARIIDYVRRPFEPSELLAAVRAALRKR
jgi:DNA-binding response OmpR family regulator